MADEIKGCFWKQKHPFAFIFQFAKKRTTQHVYG